MECWNLHHPCNVAIAFFLRSFYLSLNQPGHLVCPLSSACQDRAETLPSNSFATRPHFIRLSVCLSVLLRIWIPISCNNATASPLGVCTVYPPLLQAAFVWPCLPGLLLYMRIASYKRRFLARLWVHVLLGRISSAMSVMCQHRRGYRLLPIFG